MLWLTGTLNGIPKAAEIACLKPPGAGAAASCRCNALAPGFVLALARCAPAEFTPFGVTPFGVTPFGLRPLELALLRLSAILTSAVLTSAVLP